ncbi:hypothetical protein TrLO_g9737 [Triparma laevis f. longispina]|uniref:VOC domain-containing protein n=1 Tax=Triparma laevis f. longispina TaxID=1714387 RepID=A0A9W7ECM7_9STRA|nr:hypothetical protein TrLO_g9737 [Triparma laevis f. longispina]
MVSPKPPSSTSSTNLKTPPTPLTPFKFNKLDHIVLRVHSAQTMLDFYVGVLGAEPDRIGRMEGCLSHLRVGASMIDLHAYDSPAGRKMHAGGSGVDENAPLPERDVEKGTLDHFALNVDPYDPDQTRDYLAKCGHAVFSEGQRYGADGDGYSMYLRDPEGNIVELKSGTSTSTSTPMTTSRSLSSILETLSTDVKQDYFLTGSLTDASIYASDCYFSDPFSGFSGRDRFVSNLSNLSNFVSSYKTKLLSTTSLTPNSLTSRILVKLDLKLPWKPKLNWVWKVTHVIDEETMKVVKHKEEWEIDAGEAVMQCFRAGT